MALIDDIKDQFPAPVPASEDQVDGTCYCVGGAAVMFADSPDVRDYDPNFAFPAPASIARALCRLNRALPLDRAELFALDIVDANDDGKIGKAWAYAEQALTYRC